MKLTNVVTMVALCAGLAACSQQENPAPSPAPAETPKTQAPAAAPAEMPKAQMPAAAPAAALAPAPAAAPAVAADVSAQAQGLIDKVKDQIANKDYAGAMSTLKELSAMKLTPSQQSMVDELKAQAQKAMAGAAASAATQKATDAVGGMLGK